MIAKSKQDQKSIFSELFLYVTALKAYNEIKYHIVNDLSDDKGNGRLSTIQNIPPPVCDVSLSNILLYQLNIFTDSADKFSMR